LLSASLKTATHPHSERSEESLLWLKRQEKRDFSLRSLRPE
jgi:hypothetical protein